MNEFEAEGRRVKVEQLMAQIDRELAGTKTETGREMIADYLRAQEKDWWLGVAKRAGVKTAIEKNKVPSKKTQEAVIAEYEARAEADAKREPEEDDGLPF